MKKIKASSLMETLIALLIVSMVITITSVVFVNVSGSNSTYKNSLWNAVAQEWLEKSIAENKIVDDEKQIDNFLYVKKVEDYNGESNLKTVTISVLDGDVTVFEIQRVIGS